jgi:NAD(P)H-dependent FMN reductase
MAEHNRSYTVAFKNILDWCSRVDMNIFADKPMLLMSTSTGGFGGGNVMAMAKSFFPRAGANVIETFSLPKFEQNFIEGTIVNEELKKELLDKIELFKQKI